MHRVFVYGTLQPGEIYYSQCESRVIQAQPAIALGQLYALPLGYPAMIQGTSSVYGFVLHFRHSSILDDLDAFEQHDPETFVYHNPDQNPVANQYQRLQIATFDAKLRSLCTAWAYLLTKQQVKQLRGILIPEGKWSWKKQKSLFGINE